MPDRPDTASMRLPLELVDRAERLLPRLAADPERRLAGRLSRSAVLRLAMHRGLLLLEAELASPAQGERPIQRHLAPTP